MRVAAMNWSMVEGYLRHDDRAVLPLGCTEQHAHLSLAVDSILAERVAAEAAEPLGVPVFPALGYGITPYFLAYPGTVSLRVATYCALVQDILESLAGQGFRRFFLCNGHGGNVPVQPATTEWLAGHPGCQVRLHNWWNAPRTMAKVQETDPVASHASWMENFPWTRLEGARQPDHQKPMADLDRMRLLDAAGAREVLGDGNFGGRYQRADAEMEAIWAVAVTETRDLLETGWA